MHYIFLFIYIKLGRANKALSPIKALDYANSTKARSTNSKKILH